jgi:hypothetical protein
MLLIKLCKIHNFSPSLKTPGPGGRRRGREEGEEWLTDEGLGVTDDSHVKHKQVIPLMGEILRSYTEGGLLGITISQKRKAVLKTMVVIVVIVMLRYYSRIL